MLLTSFMKFYPRPTGIPLSGLLEVKPFSQVQQFGWREKLYQPGSPSCKDLCTSALQYPVHARPTDTMPKKKVSWRGGEGGAQEEIGEVVSYTCSCKSGNQAKKGGRKGQICRQKSANEREKRSKGKTGGSS